MLHFAMSAKCVASLRQSLQKVEPDSTLCNASYMTLLITLCDFYTLPFACDKITR